MASDGNSSNAFHSIRQARLKMSCKRETFSCINFPSVWRRHSANRNNAFGRLVNSWKHYAESLLWSENPNATPAKHRRRSISNQKDSFAGTQHLATILNIIFMHEAEPHFLRRGQFDPPPRSRILYEALVVPDCEPNKARGRDLTSPSDIFFGVLSTSYPS